MLGTKYSREIPVPGKSAQEIYDKISSDLDRFVAGYGGKFGKLDLNRDVGTKTVSLNSAMVTAALECKDGKVVLQGKLSLMASPFKAKIDEGIDKWLKKNFPG